MAAEDRNERFGQAPYRLADHVAAVHHGGRGSQPVDVRPRTRRADVAAVHHGGRGSHLELGRAVFLDRPAWRPSTMAAEDRNKMPSQGYLWGGLVAAVHHGGGGSQPVHRRRRRETCARGGRPPWRPRIATYSCWARRR